MGGRVVSRSTACHTASLDPSAFALAAAGIAAAADEAHSAEAERLDLQQQLQHLRLAADAARDVQAQLLRQVAEGGAGAVEEVDEEVARFSLLEQELQDIQASGVGRGAAGTVLGESVLR